jgi:hypothetical protein
MFNNPHITYEEYQNDSEEPWIRAREVIRDCWESEIDSHYEYRSTRRSLFVKRLTSGLEQACVLGFPDLIRFYVRKIEEIPGVTNLEACAVRSILAEHFWLFDIVRRQDLIDRMLRGIKTHIGDYTGVPLRIFAMFFTRYGSARDRDNVIISKEQFEWLRLITGRHEGRDVSEFESHGTIHLCDEGYIARREISFLTIDEVRRYCLPRLDGIDTDSLEYSWSEGDESEDTDVETLRDGRLGVLLSLRNGIQIFSPFASAEMFRFFTNSVRKSLHLDGSYPFSWLGDFFNHNRYVGLNQHHMRRVAAILDLEDWARKKLEQRDPITPDDIRGEFERTHCSRRA